MTVMITLNEVIALLKEKDNILILSHRFPDGDTLGSAYALCGALQRLGKNASVLCSDQMPDKFSYMKKAIKEQVFSPKYIVAVDVAAKKLLGSLENEYGDKVDLCIDHHSTNEIYAEKTYVESNSAATAEIIYLIVNEMLGTIPKEIADCLYTGISTDTGCFKFSNVTSRTHKIAAELIDAGCESAKISKAMFDTKSKSRIAIEKEVLEGLEFRFNGLCAIVTLTLDMIASSGAVEDDIDGISSLPRQIEGVVAGITLREVSEGGYKVSLRTADEINAAKVASKFGGGGHSAAAGCSINDSIENAKNALANAVEDALIECGLIKR